MMTYTHTQLQRVCLIFKIEFILFIFFYLFGFLFKARFPFMCHALTFLCVPADWISFIPEDIMARILGTFQGTENFFRIHTHMVVKR